MTNEQENQIIKVAVVGAAGRMGQEVLRAFGSDHHFEVVLAVDHECAGKNARDVAGSHAPNIEIEEKLGAALDRVPCDVMIDFTIHSAAAANALSAIKRKVSPVIGTTGMKDFDLSEINLQAKESGVGALYAPNFAVGAVLMMKFAEMAAPHLPHVEVIELHHEKKQDSPSGTAMRTAEMISEARDEHAPLHNGGMVQKVEGVRGGMAYGVPVHSVRLPGHVAHQMVIFGSPGETLTIRHDSIDRTCFMEGVKLCVRHVRSLEGLVVGMDKILFNS